MQTKRIIAATLSLLMLSGSAVVNIPAFNTSISASAITFNKDDVAIPSGMSNIESDKTYSGTINKGSADLRGMYYKSTKAGTVNITIKVDKTKIKDGTIKAYLCKVSGSQLQALNQVIFNKSSAEEQKISAKLETATYIVVFQSDSKCDNAAYSFTLSNTSTINMSTVTGKIVNTTNPAKPTYELYTTQNGKKTVLKKNVDYSVISEGTTSSKLSSGDVRYTTKIKVQGKGNYSGTRELIFNNDVSANGVTSSTRDLSKCEVFHSFKNNQIMFKIVDTNGKTLTKNKDYKVGIKTSDKTRNDVIYRSYDCTFTGIGNYRGTLTYEIDNHPIETDALNKRHITVCSAKVVYSGDSVKDVIVEDNGKRLKEGTDYTKQVSKTKVTSNGKTKYKYKITLYGIGKYTGTLPVTGETAYNNKIVLNLSDYTVSPKQYTGKQIRPKFTIKGTTGTLKEGRDYTLKYGKNVKRGWLAGSVTITGIGKYTGTTRIRFHIVQNKVNLAKVKTRSFTTIYTGTPAKPVRNIKMKNGVTACYGRDFIVTYKNNNKPGRAKAIIKFKGNYSGKITLPVKILNGNTQITKFVTGNRKFRPVIKNQAGTDGYQIQYSLSTDNSVIKLVNIPKSLINKKFITVSKPKQYFVRVRAYKKSGAVKLYGKWTKFYLVNCS